MSEANVQTQVRVEKLSKEKEDLLLLAMTRDKIIQVCWYSAQNV